MRTLLLLFFLATFTAAAQDKLDLQSMSAPRPIQKQEPKYTEEAREAKVQGAVRLKVFIDKEGAISQAEILEPLGFGLDLAALEALANWRFEPARRLADGTAVGVWATVEINFRLH